MAAVVQTNHLIILHRGLVVMVQNLKYTRQVVHLPPGHPARLPVMEAMVHLLQCTIM